MNNLTGFLDIHSHFLPGLDDGPEDYGQCLEAAKRYHAIGVDQVIATPHWIQGSRWTPAPEVVRNRTAEAQEWIREAGFDLRLLPGMEIALTDYLCGHFRASDFVSLGEKGFFLIEFPFTSPLSAPTAKNVRALLTRQKENRFIIAHPERCAMFQDNLDSVGEMVALGMLTQVNIGSVLGYSGKKVQMTALKLLHANLIHFLGTDSHGRAGRMPPNPQEMAELATLIGADTVLVGFRDNPHCLLSGEMVRPLRSKGSGNSNTPFPSSPKGLLQAFFQFFREH